MQTDNPLQYQKEIKKIKKTLLPWIETHYPELFNHTFDLIEQTNLIVYKKQTKNIEKKASSFYYEENFF